MFFVGLLMLMFVVGFSVFVVNFVILIGGVIVDLFELEDVMLISKIDLLFFSDEGLELL